MTRKYRYEIEWEFWNCCERKDVYISSIVKQASFVRECDSEFDAITYAIDWMESRKINASNLMYCRVEEVFDSEMRTNVLLWIGE